jgi:hypothetical protein
MALQDYDCDGQDHFVFAENYEFNDFSFPCCCCKHALKEEVEHPCCACGHNTNAEPAD